LLVEEDIRFGKIYLVISQGISLGHFRLQVKPLNPEAKQGNTNNYAPFQPNYLPSYGYTLLKALA